MTIQRKFFAGFFLLLFAFCVTPKRFLHDLLANHKDASITAGIPYQQITGTGFHCHVDDLVVVEPFLPGIQAVDPVIPVSGIVQFSQPLSRIVFLPAAIADGRGPPCYFCS